MSVDPETANRLLLYICNRYVNEIFVAEIKAGEILLNS